MSFHEKNKALDSLERIQHQLRDMMPDLSRNFGIRSVEIFGSFVRGEQKNTSDLDLLVEFDPSRSLSLFDLIGIEQMLSDILGVNVDLVEKIALKPALRQRILDEAVRV
jgi:predicted nucleotidyltransferase